MHYQRWRQHGSPLIKLTRKGMSPEERFADQVDRSAGPEGCHLWTGLTSRLGYGQILVNGKTVSTHRFAWFLANGRWPELDILHSCDNPPCVNPEHLSEGTHQENMRQMIERGRNNPSRGTRHHAAKLTPDAIEEARQLREDGWTLKQLGERFGVSISSIGRAVLGQTWKECGEHTPSVRRGGEAIHGERHANAVISDAQVEEMRYLHAAGWSRKALQERFGISKSQVQRIVTGRARAA